MRHLFDPPPLSPTILLVIFWDTLYIGRFNEWTDYSLLAEIRVQSCSKQLFSQPDDKHYLNTEQSSESVLSLVSGTKILVKIAMMRQTTEWPKKRAAKPSSWGSEATKPK